jgi:hypothetical protein
MFAAALIIQRQPSRQTRVPISRPSGIRPPRILGDLPAHAVLKVMDDLDGAPRKMKAHQVHLQFHTEVLHESQ